jgi:hypothetical protein
VYVWVESLLLTWFFRNYGLFKRNPSRFWLLCGLFTVVWLWEVLFLRGFGLQCNYFRILYSFTLVLMSIRTINHLVNTENRDIIKNPIFLLCCGIIIYFTYKMMINAFWLYGLKTTYNFIVQINIILVYINLFTNIIYNIVALLMPKKQPVALLFSSPVAESESTP